MLAVGLPAGFQESTFVDGLSVPTDMVFAPDGRLFVAEKDGTVRVVENGILLGDPFATVAAATEGERGLLGMAFDPNFKTNGFLYLYYTRSDGSPANRLSRFTVSNTDANVADPASELILLDDIPVIAAVHNGGAMGFGTDGMLYLGIGDGFNATAAQDLSSLNGKLLRLDVANGPNIIPADNPFVGTPGAREEIYSLGLRNPFKLDVDPVFGRIWVTNTGSDQFEEVHEARAGANFGWPLLEGNSGDPAFDDPVFSYPYGTFSSAITAGTFYDGNLFPTEYEGDFFFADFSNQVIRRVDLNETNDHGDDGHQHERTATDFANNIAGPVDIEIGSDGALYYLDIWTGTVFRVDYLGGSNRSPQAVATANVDYGNLFDVAFDASASSDPDEDSLTYTWDFGDGSPPGSGASVVHTYTTPGIYFARVTVDDGNGGTDISDPMTIPIGENFPVGQIEVFPENPRYRGGDTIRFSGSATDLEDGTLDASAFRWSIAFQHNEHTHPFIGPIDGVTEGTFQIPVLGETSSNVWYRVNLTVTDSSGLPQSSFVDVFPQLTSLTIDTSPGLLKVVLDGKPLSAPVAFDGVAGIQRQLDTPLLQFQDGQAYIFESWSDAADRQHTFVTPIATTTLTANYQAIASDRVAASYFVAGLYEKLLNRVADPAELVSQVDQLMAGASRMSIIQSLWQSDEYRALQVVEMYRDFLDRTPVPDEVAHWVAQFNQGATENDVALHILSSNEFVNQRNQPQDYVADLFELLFKRTGSPEEIQPWVDRLASGTTHAEVALALLTFAERDNVLREFYYQKFLDRPLTVLEIVDVSNTAQGLPLDILAQSILNSSEFLTNQVARPVVAALYNDILLRDGVDTELDFWVNKLLGGTSRQTVADSFLRSAEGVRNFITETYVTLLERLPIEAELDEWVALASGGMTRQEIISSFLDSAEFTAAHADDIDFVKNLYEKLFRRAGERESVVQWVSALRAGVTRSVVIADFLAITEYRTLVIVDAYSDFLGRMATADEINLWLDALPQDNTLAESIGTVVLSSDEYYFTAEVDRSSGFIPGQPSEAADVANELFVVALYDDLLERSASAEELGLWNSFMRWGMSRISVATQFVESIERTTLVATDLYEQLLNRLPSAREIELVSVQLAMAGQAVGQTFEILTSPEYSVLHVSDEMFVQALYQDVLQRAVDPLGLSSWRVRLELDTSRESLVTVIQQSPEAWNRMIDGVFDDLLDRDPEPEVLANWRTQLSSGAQSERELAITILSSDEYYEQQSP